MGGWGDGGWVGGWKEERVGERVCGLGGGEGGRPAGSRLCSITTNFTKNWTGRKLTTLSLNLREDEVGQNEAEATNRVRLATITIREA